MGKKTPWGGEVQTGGYVRGTPFYNLMQQGKIHVNDLKSRMTDKMQQNHYEVMDMEY